ncbi:MAG TPA: hypothetical protein VLA02_00840 [Reyranella sp.]|nr:hypothetical protein [Reyranella sp.]
MSNGKWLVGALGLVILTAGCVDNGGYYPRTAYSSGYNSGYSSPSTAYSTGYYSTNVAAAPRNNRYWNSSRRDYDGDGIPNRYDRDANGDGVPDRYQGRYARY